MSQHSFLCSSGVIVNTMRPGAKTLLDDTRAAWLKLQQERGFKDVEIQFLPIARKDDLGMDALIEGRISCHFTCRHHTKYFFFHENFKDECNLRHSRVNPLFVFAQSISKCRQLLFSRMKK